MQAVEKSFNTAASALPHEAMPDALVAEQPRNHSAPTTEDANIASPPNEPQLERSTTSLNSRSADEAAGQNPLEADLLQGSPE
eukprot:194709-Amphidinium_carterae.1